MKPASMRMKYSKLFLLIIILFIFFLPLSIYAQNIYKGHGIALRSKLKYGAGFKHFEYVNPNAPKGGEVKLSAIGTFDSLNPFILKGVTAAGIGLVFDTLTTSSSDEPFSEYGLIAKTIEVPSDNSWVAYTLRPEARWHDGYPVTADDVVFTFNLLMKEGHPFYRSYYRDVLRAEKIGKRKVRFVFRISNNPELPLIVGQLPVLSKRYYQEHTFSKTTLEPPMGSGPYKVIDVKPGRSITYKLMKDYWGKDIAVNKGRYNFGIIKYEYYRDPTVALEAFKSGEYDFRIENVSKTWATAYKGPAFDQGKIIKEELPNDNPVGMQAFVYNTRRDIFKDPKVREALAYAFDFEWTNKTLFYNAYKRTRSYFENSELASRGLPSPSELKLLNPYRDKLPKEVFTKEYSPPETDGSGNIRSNLRKALKLLNEAGWELKSGKLVNRTTGKRFVFELLLVQPSFERIALPFKKNLSRIGVEMNIRIVDSSQYVNRLNNFNFDMVVYTFRQSLSPGNEQRDFWSSKAADTPGSSNLAGIKDPIVDDLIEKVISAPDRDSLIAACRALDRVLLWGFYVIPQWHINVYRIAYWNKFARPKIKPKYGLGLLDTWWLLPQYR